MNDVCNPTKTLAKTNLLDQKTKQTIQHLMLPPNSCAKHKNKKKAKTPVLNKSSPVVA
jgi:hypothetical protein